MFDKTASWKTPQNFLLLISIIVPIAFSSWMALLNNFVVERANFDGADIGLLQSVREIPGFLAFPGYPRRGPYFAKSQKIGK